VSSWEGLVDNTGQSKRLDLCEEWRNAVHDGTVVVQGADVGYYDGCTN